MCVVLVGKGHAESGAALNMRADDAPITRSLCPRAHFFVPKHVLQHVSQSFNAQSLAKPMITPIFALTAAARGYAPSPGVKINLEANRLKVSVKATMEGS